MRLKSLFVVAAASLVAFPAFAQDAAPTPAQTPVPEKKICRSLVPTGSIMGKKVCMTKSEWKQFNDNNSANAQDGMERRRTDGNSSAR